MAFNENTRVKLPAILHLCRLGYTYLPLGKAKWDPNTNIFTGIFLESVGKLNPERTPDEIKRTLDEVTLSLDNEDLGQTFYKLLTSGTGVKLFDSFLLGFALLHGVNGLRYSIEDYFKRPGTRFWLKVILFVVAGAMFVAGVMTLWAFSFEEMGDAIRNLTPPQ
ncbi:MAG TPA: hypothetical protein PLL18_03635 [Flavobacteriales bacterium]|nr:hypothetical protein [Flavobacteriales bacterium]